jgi:hypothetical protein
MVAQHQQNADGNSGAERPLDPLEVHYRTPSAVCVRDMTTVTGRDQGGQRIWGKLYSTLARGDRADSFIHPQLVKLTYMNRPKPTRHAVYVATPDPLKRLQGNPGKRPLNDLEPQPTLGIAEPPDIVKKTPHTYAESGNA